MRTSVALWHLTVSATAAAAAAAAAVIAVVYPGV